MTVRRRCSHPQCTTTVDDDRLACPAHWSDLPIALRNRIWKHDHYGNHRAHAIAVREAVAYWTPEPVTPRCYSCRTPAPDLVDVEVGKPICLPCARLGATSVLGSKVCGMCKATTDVLVGVDSDPDVCFDCAIRLVAV